MKEKPSVLLIGGLPRPSGGVTVFLGRLVNHIGGDISFHVLDIHQGEKEPSKAKSHRIAPRNKIFKLLWLLWNILIFRGDIIHFNYSSCHGLIALALIPKLKRRFFITLHNGSQLEKLDALGWLGLMLVRRGARKIDVAFSLCSNHCDIYRCLEVPSEKIVRTKTQIPPPHIKPLVVDEKHLALRSSCEKIIVSSGHVNRTYNFEFLISYINSRPEVGGLLFFYGDHQDLKYLHELQESIKDCSRLLFYFHKDEKTFLSALVCSDAYVRPTHVDSWGIAVADAISLGVPAIASGVCERSQGAVICSNTDFSSFADNLDLILSGTNTLAQVKRSYANDFLVAYNNRQP